MATSRPLRARKTYPWDRRWTRVQTQQRATSAIHLIGETTAMIRTMQEFIQAFRAVRRVSTPLVAVRTPDPAGTIDIILSVLNGSAEEIPVLHWDIMRGLAGVNNAGKAEAQKLLGDGDPAMVSARPSDALALARRLPEN